MPQHRCTMMIIFSNPIIMKTFFSYVGMAIQLYISSCSSPNKNEQAKGNTFKITNPIFIDTVYYKEYVADIHSIKNVEIRTRVYGQIEKIHVDEGQTVREGQLLFSISSHSYREDLIKAKAVCKNAKAEARTAELDLQNVKQLLGNKVVSQTEVDMSQSKLDALNAKIEEAQSNEASAQLRLSFTEIKAPFDGVINRIPLKAGSLIDEGTLLTSLSDSKEVFAYFNVSENEYLDFVLNTKESSEKNEVSLLLANSTEHSHLGKVEIIEGEIDKVTGSISFRARFPNPKKILKHGSSGKIRLKKSLQHAFIIPQKSTFEVQDKTYLYLVDSTNTVVLKSIDIKLVIPHFYVIQPLLKSTDKIIFEGIQRVKEGEKITSEFISMNEILKLQDK